MAFINITIEKLILEVKEPMDVESKQILAKILKNTNMAQEILTELKGKVTALETSLDNIKGDITTIKDGLPAEGGLTADEVAELRAALDGAVSKADALDKENEPTTTEPPTEQPA